MVIYEVYAVNHIKPENKVVASRKIIGWTESEFLAKEYMKMMKQSKARVKFYAGPPNFEPIDIIPDDIVIEKAIPDIRTFKTEGFTLDIVPSEYMGIIDENNHIITLTTEDWSMTAICTKQDGLQYKYQDDEDAVVHTPAPVRLCNNISTIELEIMVRKVTGMTDLIMSQYFRTNFISPLKFIRNRSRLQIDLLKLILQSKKLQRRTRIFLIQTSERSRW